jgi:hypothetical protein
MEDKKQYVATLPNGMESYHEVSTTEVRSDKRGAIARIATEAVARAGIRQPRNVESAPIYVKVCALNIRQGTLVRQEASVVCIHPPLEPMTEEDYSRDLAEALSNLPPEFAEYVSGKAYEDGHSAGYEEVVSMARSMASSLKIAVDKYNKRLGIK